LPLSIIVPAAVISVPGILRANGPTDLVTLPIVAAIISIIIVNAFVYKRIISLAAFLDTSRNEEGDLTQRMPNERTKELYAIARGHNVFVAQIHRIVFKLKNIVRKGFSISQELAQKTSEVAKSLDEIAESSRSVTSNERKLNEAIRDSRAHVSEIRDAIRKIVAQIESQAASVDQSSAAVEESIASIRNMNNISRSKAEFVETLNTLARESGGNMRGTMEAMRGIASSVDLITDLIGVIDEVAEKTNLLALNAAIEAAHAGDHGKGFAVVADEIGKLAEATSESAGEVNKNLSSMIAEIESARALTEHTDSSIEQLLGGISEVSDSFSEIIRGLDEMSSGTTEITNSLTQLVDITEEARKSRSSRRQARQLTVMTALIEVSESRSRRWTASRKCSEASCAKPKTSRRRESQTPRRSR
jgi:methyl-accepting chemotaxis protein